MAYWKEILLYVLANAVLFAKGKAHLHVFGYINKKNFHYWVESNLHHFMKGLNTTSLMHCSRFWCLWSLDFFFLGMPNSYSNFPSLCSDATQILEFKLTNLGNLVVLFQHDGTTVHTARWSPAVLRSLFLGRLISLHHDVQWQTHSSETSIYDFFLWRH